MKHKLNLIGASNASIRLVEIYCPNNGEVTWFREFPVNDGRNGEVSLDLKELMLERGYDVLRMSIWDDKGNSKSFQINKKLLQFIEYYV